MAARPIRKSKPQHKPAYRQMVKQLYELRQASGHTQRSLAQAIRLPASTIHKIEHGDRRIDPIEFMDWCKACGADPGQTLNGL